MTDPVPSLGAEFWPDAFRVTIAYLATQEQNPAPWARAFCTGLPYYQRDDRRDLVRALVASFGEQSLRDVWRRALASSPGLAGCLASTLAELAEGGDSVPELEQARASLAAMPVGPADIAPLPSVAGSVRCLIRVPDTNDFAVEDLVANTVPRPRRTERREAQLVDYANSTLPIDQCLSRLHAFARLPGDDEHPHVLHTLCVPLPFPIGDAEEQSGGRSLDLAAFVAAASFRYRWSFVHDRVLLTGMIDLEREPYQVLTVQRVEYVPEKLDAVIAWATATRQPVRESLLLLPRENEHDAEPKLAALEAAGVRVRFVRTFDEVLAALPFHVSARRSRLSRVEWVFGALIFLWWAERLLFGEFFSDHAGMVAHGYSFGRYAALSMLPPIAPVGAFLGSLAIDVAVLLRRPWRVVLLTGALVFAGHAMFALQWFAGGLDFPERAQKCMYRSEGAMRAFDVYKDIAIIYPTLVALFGLIPLLALRASELARLDRRQGSLAGQIWLARRSWAQLLPRIRWGIMPVVAGLLGVHLLLFSRDFIENFRCRNFALVAHMGYQIGWPVVLGVIVFFAVGDPGAPTEEDA